MISEGRTPIEHFNDKELGDTTEMKILKKMVLKYSRVVEFYT